MLICARISNAIGTDEFLHDLFCSCGFLLYPFSTSVSSVLARWFCVNARKHFEVRKESHFLKINRRVKCLREVNPADAFLITLIEKQFYNLMRCVQNRYPLKRSAEMDASLSLNVTLST